MDHGRKYIHDLQKTLDQLPLALIDEVISILHEARLNHRQIFIMGNGGSASTASHFAADLSKNTRQEGIPNFRAMCLADNMAIMSAYANDEGYDNVFAQQLANFVRPYDVVTAISASGNSLNVVKAVELARKVRAKTIGFTGFDGGSLGSLVDVHIHIASSQIEHVEDVHLMAEHLICKTLRELAAQPTTPEYSGGISTSGMETGDILQGVGLEVSNPANMFPMKSVTRNSVDLLYAISNELDSELELQEILQRVLSLTIDNLGASSGSVLILDENGEVNESVMTYAGKVLMDKHLDDIVDRGLARWVIENGQSALIASTRNDPRWLPRVWDRGNGSSRSAVCVPLMHQERVVGVMTLVHPREGKFTNEDLTLLTAIAVCISFIGFRALLRTQ